MLGHLALACLKCYTVTVKPRTAAEKYFERRRANPSYAEAHERALRRVEMFDDMVRSLDARREELGMTKAELARRADMPPAVVRRLFSQQRKNPTLASLVAIADALGMWLCVAPEKQLLRVPRPGSEEARDPVGSTQVLSRAYGTRRRTA